MSDAENELSQDESAVEITPLPAEKELPAGTDHKSAALVNRALWSGAWRYILTAVVLCLAGILVGQCRIAASSIVEAILSFQLSCCSVYSNSCYFKRIERLQREHDDREWRGLCGCG